MYTTAIRFYVPDEHSMKMAYFFGAWAPPPPAIRLRCLPPLCARSLTISPGAFPSPGSMILNSIALFAPSAAICLFADHRNSLVFSLLCSSHSYLSPSDRAGFIGMSNAIILLPLVLALHYTHTEPLNALTFEIFGLIVVKGLFDNVLSDMLWARSIMLTSPTVATVGAPSPLLIPPRPHTAVVGVQRTQLYCATSLRQRR